MTKERVSELEMLVESAIADCEQFGDLVDGHILEFWRGAKMIVDELKLQTGTDKNTCSLNKNIREVT